MRLIFAGTPEFACVALRRLCNAGFDVALVLTQPDRPAGRGMKMHESPVKQFARERGIAVAQPRSLRLDGRFSDDACAVRQTISDARARVMVVAAYGLILPQWVLDLMQQPYGGTTRGLGCINIHASLLPRWRGAAPIHRAIEAGDAYTGVTIMQMDAGLDTGAMLLSEASAIVQNGPAADTTGSLHDKLAALGAELVVKTLEQARRGDLSAHAQPGEGVTYAHKVEKEHARVDWACSAQLVERRLRAFNPAPGAWTQLDGELVKLWRSEVGALPGDSGAPCGTILSATPDGIEVACGQGMLRLCELQRAGGKRLDAGTFLRGTPLQRGMRFGTRSARA